MPKKDQARRPRSVTILVSVQLLQGLILLGYGFTLIVRFGWPGTNAPMEGGSQLAALYDVLTSGGGQILFSLPVLFIAFALYRLRSWAWMAAMALQGYCLLFSLFAYAIQRPIYPIMLLGIILVFYLNQQDVQVAYQTPQTQRGMH